MRITVNITLRLVCMFGFRENDMTEEQHRRRRRREPQLKVPNKGEEKKKRVVSCSDLSSADNGNAIISHLTCTVAMMSTTTSIISITVASGVSASQSLTPSATCCPSKRKLSKLLNCLLKYCGNYITSSAIFRTTFRLCYNKFLSAVVFKRNVAIGSSLSEGAISHR